jgi:RNA polymerase sigma-70 factor (ECF subfamily)
MTYFQRRLASRAEAEDLTQEVFLRLAQRVETDEREIADGFIFTIAANLLRDRSRRARARSFNRHIEWDSDVVQERDEALVDCLEPERVLLSREVLSRILTALDRAGPRTRDVFLLYRLEGMKHREIAQLFAISVSAVEKHIVRALKHLAAVLDDNVAE